MPTATDRLCVICGERKPASQFERKGEHIVPRFLGNRRLRTPFVCRACNGGLGGTIDLALKSAPGVAAACFNRGAGRSRGERDAAGQSVRLDSVFNHCINKNNHSEDQLKNPGVRGAVLKIAYESAHLRLGDAYLTDPTAAVVREMLFAFVNKEKGRAYELLDAAKVYAVDINAFHAAVRSPRCEFVKRAIAGKSCLNSIWIVPLNSAAEFGQALAVVIDIDGLQPSYAVVGESSYNIDTPELIFPQG